MGRKGLGLHGLLLSGSGASRPIRGLGLQDFRHLGFRLESLGLSGWEIRTQKLQSLFCVDQSAQMGVFSKTGDPSMDAILREHAVCTSLYTPTPCLLERPDASGSSPRARRRKACKKSLCPEPTAQNHEPRNSQGNL